MHESGEHRAAAARHPVFRPRQALHGEGVPVHALLSPPDPVASKQISRRHFARLHSRAEGFVIRAPSAQPTEVDGVLLARDQNCPCGPAPRCVWRA